MKKCENILDIVDIYIRTNIPPIQKHHLSLPIFPHLTNRLLRSKDNVASDKMALDVSEPQLQTFTSDIEGVAFWCQEYTDWLVVEPTHLKNMTVVKLEIFSK